MTSSKSSRVWLWTAVFAFTLFSFLRFYHLADRPMHNDEGVNGFFTNKLLKSHVYKYDPTNYHGPTLYFFQVVPSKLFGLSVTSTRSTTALASLIFLAGFLLCRPFIGIWGSMAALFLAGLSTDVLFYSRYFIHETYVLLFTFGVFVGAVKFFETRRPSAAYAAVLSAVLLFCTKETGVLHLAVMSGALLAALFFAKNRPTVPIGELFWPLRRHWWWFALMAVATWMLLFSSFFTNMGGLRDSFVAYVPWARQGMESGHEKAWPYYIATLLWPYETGLVLLTAAGALIAIIKSEFRGWFLTFWTLGTIAVYSLIPYKTPWLVVNLVLPMSLLAGYGIQCVVDWTLALSDPGLKRRIFTALVLLVTVAVLIKVPLMLKVNYIESDNERHPQIYVHTSNDIFRLLRDINDVARKTGEGDRILINVVTPQYWPLPFYLKDFPNAKFWGTVDIQGNLEAPLVLAASNQRSEVRKALKGSYAIKNYVLRPGYYLDLWTNNAFIEPFQPPLTVPDLLKAQRPPGNLLPGLREETFMNERTEGSPLIIRTGRQDVQFYFDNDEQKPIKAPFSIRWTGFLKIPAAGVYRFSLDSDDGSKLIMDDVELVDNSGSHALRRASRSANLSAGYHKIELTYNDVGGTAEFDFFWKRPAFTREERVPGFILFSSR